MQLSSRLFLRGLLLGASIFLAFTPLAGTPAQAQACWSVTESSSCPDEGSESTCDSFATRSFVGDSFCTSGDHFSTAGRSFPSCGDQFVSSGNPGTQVQRDTRDYNYAFSDTEQIDPSLYTWSDDPHDLFAARTADPLPASPAENNPRYTFSFISVSDGPQIEAVTKKSFEAPRAHPQYQEYYIAGKGLPKPIAGTTIDGPSDSGTPLYGWHYTHGQVRVYFAGDTDTVRNGLIKETFISCMKDWCAPTEGLLRFTVVADFRCADIIVCREFTTSHELAENMPSFKNGWLDRVKIRLIDSTCDSLAEPQLRAVLLHSAGHALGYFGHTMDRNSAMNENCSHVNHPIQKMCPCDIAYIRDMYISYKTCWDNRFKKDPPTKVVRVPWGQGIPVAMGAIYPLPAQKCQKVKTAKSALQSPLGAKRDVFQRLPRLPKKIAAAL